MHVHFGLKLPGAAGAALVNENDMQLVMRMADNARKSLYVGVTTVRLTGENHGSDFALKGAIDGGAALGPRIHTAGEIIAATGGHGDLEADGAAEMAKVVREQIKAGATWIKVAISGGISDSHGSISASSLCRRKCAPSSTWRIATASRSLRTMARRSRRMKRSRWASTASSMRTT